MSINSPIQTMKIGGRNLAIALVAMFSVATVGMAGTTYAVNNGGGDGPTNGAPTSKEDCKDGGWKKYGFKNQGQCIKWVNEHGYGGGNGGGNHGNVSTWLNLNVSGDNNVVNLVINYIFG
jgi:hypothetical protein